MLLSLQCLQKIEFYVMVLPSPKLCMNYGQKESLTLLLYACLDVSANSTFVENCPKSFVKEE